MMWLPFLKLHTDAKMPVRSNPSDAGADVFLYSPDTPELVLEPGENVVCSTGLKGLIPHGYMLQVMNRSGQSSKRSLVVGACVCDPGYLGEIKIDLHNIGRRPQVLKHEDKIAQLVLIPVVHFIPIECKTEEELTAVPLYISNRKDGGFGSTGK